MKALMIALLFTIIFVSCATAQETRFIRQNETLYQQQAVLEKQERTIQELSSSVYEVAYRLDRSTELIVHALEEAADLSTMFNEINRFVETILEEIDALRTVVDDAHKLQPYRAGL